MVTANSAFIFIFDFQKIINKLFRTAKKPGEIPPAKDLEARRHLIENTRLALTFR